MHRTSLGLRIEQRLQELDRDQRWLATRLDVSAPTVARWLDGSRRISVDDLKRIALVLHRPAAWLLTTEVESGDQLTEEVHV